MEDKQKLGSKFDAKCQNELDIIYTNINSLTIDKAKQLTSYVHDHHTDIILLNEIQKSFTPYELQQYTNIFCKARGCARIWSFESSDKISGYKPGGLMIIAFGPIVSRYQHVKCDHEYAT